MPNQISIYEPRTMGRVIERMPETKTFLRDLLFSNVEIVTSEKIDVDFKKGNRAVAPFVHKKIGSKIVPNSGYETKTYTPPILAPKKITTVDDLLNRNAGENIYNGKTPEDRAIEKMMSDFMELESQVSRREELMCAQALFEGEITIFGEGLNEVISFDFTNRETIISETGKWNNPASDPITDLKRWRETVQKEGYVNCNVCIMSSDVASAFINHDKVKSILDIKAYDVAVIKPRELASGATYIGTISMLGLDIYQYNEWYLDDWTTPEAPVQKPMVPESTLGLFSTSANYTRFYGAVTILDKDGNFSTVEGERVPETYVKREPAARFLKLNSRPLPVPHEVNSWFIAKVL